MKTTKHTALELLKNFLVLLFIDRDAEKALALCTQDVQWFGTAEHEDVHGLAEASEYIRRETKAYPASYQLEFFDGSEQFITEDIHVAYLRVNVTGQGLSMRCRITGTTRLEDGTVKFCSMHMSVPNASQVDGEYFPFSLAKKYEQELYHDLLNNWISGGLLSVYFEPGYPLYMVNQRLLDCLGYADEASFRAAVGGGVINAVHPEDRQRIEQALSGHLNVHEEYELTYRMQKSDGSYLWFNDRGRILSSPEGRRIVIGICFDITKQKKAEEALAQRAEKAELLDMLVNNTSGGICSCRMDAPFIAEFANDTYFRIIGYTREQFEQEFGNSIEQIIHPEDLPRIKEQLAEQRGFHDPDLIFEYRIIRRDGTIAYLRCGAVIQPSKNDNSRMVGLVIDVTRSKLAEQKYIEQAEEIRQIYNTIPGGAFRCKFNADWDVEFANDGMFQFLGYTRKEFSERCHNKMIHVIHEDDRAPMISSIQSQLVHGPLIENVNRLVCKDGSVKWIAIHALLSTKPNGEQSFYCLFVDVTAQKEAERRVRTR